MPTVHNGHGGRGLAARRIRKVAGSHHTRTPEEEPQQTPKPARQTLSQAGRKSQPSTRRTPRLPQHLTVAGIAATLAEFKDISEARGDLDKRYEQLRKHLDGVPAGLYGDWLLGWNTPHLIIDHEANAELLESLGHEVPKKLSKPPIQVDYVPQVHTD